MENETPILWPAHALPHQLWYFQKTEHPNQYLIVSVSNGLALDARTGREVPRQPVMWSRHGQSHQRWRLHPTDDGAACFVESVRTGHVLDVPWEAGPDKAGHGNTTSFAGNAWWGKSAILDRYAIPRGPS